MIQDKAYFYVFLLFQKSREGHISRRFFDTKKIKCKFISFCIRCVRVDTLVISAEASTAVSGQGDIKQIKTLLHELK